MSLPPLPLDTFEDRLREVLRSRVEFIELIGEDLAAAGGKRLRPSLVYLSMRLLGGQDAQAHDLAVAIELLHSASLLHDDLLDNADTRRGRETAFRRFGNVVSVMSGDYMLSKLLVLLGNLPDPGAAQALTRAFGETAAAVCEGEVLQFQVAAYGEYSLEHYLDIIRGKTGVLIELAVTAPALLLRAPHAHLEALRTFGREYGLAFQMQDDLLDLASDEATLGKPVGGDLHEGKATYPVLLLLDGPDGPEVRDILERRASRPEDVERVRTLAAVHGVFGASRQEIARRSRLAVQALSVLPASPARERLESLAMLETQRVK
ncbi:polyprenyl synthetase family protein [Deinococcus aquiradiocola]|uniref:Octaprenyl-diphosphate synthase n=1 Tax=Deinococcus aquiradiocola TaxID=393059 RepID=A0A917P6P0_9DEIO|nr:polyprenyl synthetase family protein [Deinococcus aquiradiocola]GGJ63971.1 octaprenyl-diphosphate synthase [Deinococcus aquiradiocola]